MSPLLDIFRRFYWRAVWLLGAHFLRLWLLADSTDKPGGPLG